MGDLTHVLSAFENGDPHAAAQLLPLVYDELRRLAAKKMAHEKPGQTLDATALVHEAYLRLVGKGDLPRWQNSRHFFAAAKEAMRRILIENARRKKNRPQLRGIDLDLFVGGSEPDPDDLLSLEAALLAGVLDEDAAHGLGGCGEEVAAVVPVVAAGSPDQPEVGFVDQSSRLKSVPRRLGS